jgi:sialate O-acetylesterase
MVEQYQRLLNNVDGARDEARAMQKVWEAHCFIADPGNKGVERGWAKATFEDGAWADAELPGAWTMPIDGAVWYRRAIEIPAAWAGKKLRLSLGAIDDFDVTYFNGEPVGTTGIETPDWWMAPREYVIPGKLVKAGRAVLAVRVFDRFAAGGFTGPASAMWMAPAAGGEGAIVLHGRWKFEVEYSVPHDRPMPPIPPVVPGDSPNAAGVLYNGMLHGLRRMPIRGAIWYQGESNADRAAEYRVLLPAMIRSWREAWGAGELPFGIVQLANYTLRQEVPGDSTWAELREAQDGTARDLPHCGQALAVDIGDAVDIHPTNKQEVGRRLALWALAQVYGRGVEYSGPMFESMAIAGATVRVKFRHAAGGLATQDGAAATGFALAGEDRKFVWAQATIAGDTVVLRSDKVAHPVAVRYAWADNPACNLCNAAHLPAAPFRTDAWPAARKGG